MDLVWDRDRGRFDIALTAKGGVSDTDPLFAAVVASLFTDQTADPAEMVPELGADRRGWWADAGDPPDRRMGSLLWLEHRPRKDAATRRRFEEKAEIALQWLIDDGIAVTVKVTAVYPPDLPEWIGLQIRIVRPDGSVRDWRLDELWKVHAP